MERCEWNPGLSALIAGTFWCLLVRTPANAMTPATASQSTIPCLIFCIQAAHHGKKRTKLRFTSPWLGCWHEESRLQEANTPWKPWSLARLGITAVKARYPLDDDPPALLPMIHQRVVPQRCQVSLCGGGPVSKIYIYMYRYISETKDKRQVRTSLNLH